MKPILLLSMALSFITLAFASEELGGKGVMEKLKPSVFQIKTSVTATAQKNSYGTGFVIDKSGILATNFHVVANAVTNENEFYHVYLVDKDTSIEGSIVGVDVVHDLALIKVKRSFDRALNFASSYPKQGASVFSVGLPEDVNMSIITGIYNDFTKNGAVYENSHLSAPLNSGMSGGPTVNERGEIIGVNVSTLYRSQNISFAVPKHYLLALYEKAKKKKFKILDREKLFTEIAQQLNDAQTELLTELKTAPKEKLDLPGWTIYSPPQTIRCWGERETDKKKTIEHDAQMCGLQQHVFLNRDVSSTYYEFSYTAIKNKKRNRFQFYDYVNKTQRQYMERLDSSAWKEPECFEEKITNNNQIPFRVKGCLSAFKYAYGKGLYRGVFHATSQMKGDEALTFRYKIVGFSKEGIKESLQMHINSIAKR